MEGGSGRRSSSGKSKADKKQNGGFLSSILMCGKKGSQGGLDNGKIEFNQMNEQEKKQRI